MENLQALLTASENYYSAAHAQMRRWDLLYRREFALDVLLPENVNTHKSSRAAQIVDSLRDQIRTDEPRATYRARSVSEAERNRKALMEMWGASVLLRAIETNMADPIAQAPHDLLLRGAAGWKLMVRDEALADKPGRMSEKTWQEEQARQYPFIVRSVDPLLLLPSPGTGALKYMIETQTRRVLDMEAYPTWTDPKAKRLAKKAQKDPFREVKWVEFWSPEEYVVEVDGEEVLHEDNPYGFVPYVFRYSGLGRSDAEGDPRTLAIGILSAIEGELEAEIEIKTAMRAQWMFHVFPILLTTDDPGKVAKQVQKGPGAVIRHTVGQPPQWMQTPPPNQQMLDFLGNIEAAISLAVPPALTQRQADYGIHQALLIGQALKIISPIKKTLNAMGSELVNHMARLAELYDLPMNVGGTKELSRGRMVRGKDFTQQALEIQFEATDPTEDDRRMLSALAVKREPGLMSRQTYREKFLPGVVTNDEEEQVRIAAETVFDQLVASGMLAQVAMQKIQAAQEAGSLDNMITQARTAASGDLVAGRERTYEAAAESPGALAETRETAQAGATP